MKWDFSPKIEQKEGGVMILKLEPYSEKPIYEQLILEIKRGIITGELVPGESLPSVRSLAADIGINLHTVNKVYKFLQAENILVKEKSGFKVSPDQRFIPTEETMANIRQLAYELQIEKKLHQLSDEEFLGMMASVEEELIKR